MSQLDRQAIRVRIVEPDGQMVFRADVPAEIVEVLGVPVITVPAAAFDLPAPYSGLRLEVADNAQPHATQDVAPDDVINRD